LYANSYFFGHLKNLNRLFHLDETVFEDIGVSNYDRYGFLPKTRPILEENIQAGIDDAVKWLSAYQVLPENVEGLEKIAAYSQKGVTIIIFETPVESSYYDHFTNREADYQNYFQTVENVSLKYDIPFIRLTDPNVLPTEGWWNENHLNLEGANAFSSWLADQVSSTIDINPEQ